MRNEELALMLTMLWVTSVVQAATLSTPDIPGVVRGGTPIETLREDFQGSEGPLALPDGSLLFAENEARRVTRIAVDGSVSEFLSAAAGPNALGLSPRGELIAVTTAQPRLVVIHPAANARTLVDQVLGKPLNRPNDLVIDRKGGVYFTDPGGRVKPGESPPQPVVYYLSPDGQLRQIAGDVALPNGIQLSPDEKTLYVANSQGEFVLAYDVADDGSIKGRRDFARLAGLTTTGNRVAGGADGLAVDSEGRLYVATGGGVQVFDSHGAPLGIITLPKSPQNLAFAGKDKHSLYVVGRGAVYRITMVAQGFTGRAK